MNEFLNTIHTKVGILFIYDSKDIDKIAMILDSQIFSDMDVMNILEHQFTSYSLEYGSTDSIQVYLLFKLVY